MAVLPPSGRKEFPLNRNFMNFTVWGGMNHYLKMNELQLCQQGYTPFRASG